MIILKCKKDLDRMKGDYESIDEDMKKILAELLIYEILSVVEEIPEGKVASYGQIAALIGREKNARLVGKVLSEAGDYGDYPCHRVVNRYGGLAPRFAFGGSEAQRILLEGEGVEVRGDDTVDIEKYLWQPGND